MSIQLFYQKIFVCCHVVRVLKTFFVKKRRGKLFGGIAMDIPSKNLKLHYKAQTLVIVY